MDGRQPDFYALLGVERSASPAEVDDAYRRAARATHPDVHPDDASAAERFRAVATAYDTLGDPQRRAAYDDARAARRRIAVHGPAATRVPPVPLGRPEQQAVPQAVPQALPLRPVRPTPVDGPIEDSLFQLADALSRIFFARRFP